MAVLNVVLLVLFIIVAILLVLLVLVQNEEGDSLGGFFAGGSSSVFGSRSGNMLTRASSVLGVLFLVLSFGIALANRTHDDSGVEAAGRRASVEQGGVDWFEEESTLDTGDSPALTAPSEEISPDVESE
ncbi:MAG: preprotein translocase subunit SecG [Spirochaetaceae bacterium]|jgi:preprotein translocase subunit SecG|nr:preprotein translocase subunit SecG [Spirochaetaceae bacterium]